MTQPERTRGPCHQCVFYRPAPTALTREYGECTARAPRSTEVAPTSAIWPSVRWQDGCGDFQRAPT